MDESLSRSISRALATAILWTACVLLSVTYTRESGGLAMVWPAGAVLTAVLLVEQSGRRWMPILAVCMASAVMALFSRYGPLIAGLLTMARVGEAVLAAWIIGRFIGVENLLNRPGHMLRFALAMPVANLPSAILVATKLTVLSGQDWTQILAVWMASHVCGQLILTPVLLIIRQTVVRYEFRDFHILRFLRATGILAVVAGVTALAFMQTTYAVTFVIVPALLIATFHLRTPGAAAAVLVIAIVGSICLISGRGPFALMPVALAQRALVMELFIATMFLCALPLAAVLNERDRLAHQAMRHHANLLNVANRVVEVLFRVDDQGRWAYLSPAYQAITGRPVDQALGRRVVAELPRGDRRRLLDGFRQLQTGEAGDVLFSTTLLDALGEPRFIEATLFRVTVDDEPRFGIGGIFRDVTVQKQLERTLEDRAHRAQLAARESGRAARTDELTGLANRRAFLEHLDDRLADQRPFTLALFDIDHFKRINDRHGHPAGDEVLRRIAAISTAGIDGNSMIARIGGEEFAVLIDSPNPGRDLSIAAGLVEAIRAEPIGLSGTITEDGEDAIVQLTISMGVVSRCASHGPSELLAAADRALYAAKKGGRDQLRLAA